MRFGQLRKTELKDKSAAANRLEQIRRRIASLTLDKTIVVGRHKESILKG